MLNGFLFVHCEPLTYNFKIQKGSYSHQKEDVCQVWWKYIQWLVFVMFYTRLFLYLIIVSLTFYLEN